MDELLLILGDLGLEVSEDAELLTVASDLVDIACAGADTWTMTSARRIDVIASADNALEIGCAVLGRTQPRTIEGGERALSPLNLFPYGGITNAEANASREALIELYDVGAIEHPGGRDGIMQYPDSLFNAVSAYRERRNGRAIRYVAFGADAIAAAEAVNVGPRIRLLVGIELENAVNSVRLLNEGRDVELSQNRRAGIRMGVQFAHLVSALELGDDFRIEIPPDRRR